jgi:hypothetical protein
MRAQKKTFLLATSQPWKRVREDNMQQLSEFDSSQIKDKWADLEKRSRTGMDRFERKERKRRK